MPTNRKTKPQLRAPYFFHMFELFPPVSERSLYTFQQIVLNEAHYNNSKTYIRFRAWEYSCITHNYLMAEQKYRVVNSIFGKEYEKTSGGLPDYREDAIGRNCLLLTINDEFGPHVTELLPQDRPASLDDIYRALQILHDRLAHAHHPGDISQLGIAIRALQSRQRTLYAKAWGWPA